MGQYYIIVSVDNREYIDPSTFKNGNKLLEFGASSASAMLAVALLTASGNGCGGGDICRTVTWKDGDDQPKDWEPAMWERVDRDATIEAFETIPGYQIRTIVPACSGQWAGARIVTAGDYGPSGEFIDRTSELVAGLHHKTTEAMTQPRNCGKYIRDLRITYNLQDLAFQRFMDIGDQVKESLDAYNTGLSAAEMFNNQVNRLLRDKLSAEFPWRVRKKTRGGTKLKYRLDWMPPETFDNLMRSWWDPEDLKKLKAWLRDKCVLTPWQREALRYYRGRVNGRESVNHEKILEVWARHGLHLKDSFQFCYPPAIPAEHLLYAALNTQALADKDDGQYWAAFIPRAINAISEEIVTTPGGPRNKRAIQLR